MFFSLRLVFVFICLSSIAMASPLDIDTFIKKSSMLLGKSFKEIAQKTNLKMHDKRINKGILIYKASNTGLNAEAECNDITFYFKENKLITVHCDTTENIAGKSIDKAYERYKGNGGGVGTGTYVWCLHGQQLEIAIPLPSAYIAVHSEPCSAKLKEYFKQKYAE